MIPRRADQIQIGAVPRRDPIVWLIQSEKTGDVAQLAALAAALPWPCVTKRVAVRQPYMLGKPRVAASLHHVDPRRSDPLQPPWPDLVITIGRRMAMVALWIKAQSAGHTKIVLLGAPKRLAGHFDLAVVTEQYRPVPGANEMRITYPLQRIDEAEVAAAAEAHRAEFAQLRRPLIAFMVGGATKAVRFDAAVAANLVRDAVELTGKEQGTLVVITSRRTPPNVVDVLRRELPREAILHEWASGSPRSRYHAILGLADSFVVTSDSLSMIMEIARLGRPLAIYRLPDPSWRTRYPVIGSWASRGASSLGGRHRDLTAIPRALVRDGLASWFGEPTPHAGHRPPDEVRMVAERVVDLVG